MKAIISGEKASGFSRLLTCFGLIRVKKKLLSCDGENIFNFILPVPERNYEKTINEIKRKCVQNGIKQLLFEKDMKKKYADAFEADYRIVDGHSVMLTKLSETLPRILKLYGIKKGKLRLALAGQHFDRELVELLKRNNEYLNYLICKGGATTETERLAEELYAEYGINTLFKERLDGTECDMILYTDGALEPEGKTVKFIIDLSGKSVRTKVPVLGDYCLGLPPELSKFNCRHVELCELLERDYPLKGFGWMSY